MSYTIPITHEDVAKIAEIVRLHDEAFKHYLACGDECHKSSEGWVRVNIPDYFSRQAGEGINVEVYSYALGPSRMHEFSSADEALAEVRRWHEAEMALDHSNPEYCRNGHSDTPWGEQ